jgi:y4mF family transcriptional regulator
MKKRFFSLLLVCFLLLSALPGLGQEAHAASYMSNKTEIPINLEVSGAEALCQTEDGYVWIAQYSGLTRYDAKGFETYRSFVYDGQEYAIINVRALAAKGSTLYVATSEHVFIHRDSHFEPLVLNPGVIIDILLDEKNDLLYISTHDHGGIIYDISSGAQVTIHGTEGLNIRDIALAVKKVRKAQKITQTELAQLSSVGLRFVCDVERGKESVHAGKLLAVLATLGIAVELDIPE